MKVLEINSKDLDYNVKKIKEKAGDTKIIAVLKANGYGLGLAEFANFLVKRDIKYFAVSSVEEAILLSNLKLEATVLCMEATSVEKELELLIENNIVITIDNKESAKLLNKIAKERKLKAHVHLKIDTGFSRYGFSYDEKERILEVIRNNASLFFDGVFSHFSCAYFDDSIYTNLQFERFMDVKSFLEDNDVKIPIYHIANSSAFLKYPNMYLDAVRIGSAFLGRISVKNVIDLKKIGMIKSNVVDIRRIDKGTPIGYSNSEVAKNEMKIAIVPVGYADGFNIEIANDTFKFIDKLRILKNAFKNVFNKNRISLKINDAKYNVIGRVGMNHVAIDVTHGDVKIDDIVEIEINPVLVSSMIRREYI